MRKITWLILLALLGVMVTPMLAQDEELEPWVCPDGYQGQTLNIYNWSTYIAEDTVPNFEELCGVTVNYDIYESGEALLARIRQGNPGYDIIVPSDITVFTMIREGLLVPLDHDLIPNIANLDEDFIDPPYDPNNQYSLPYQWGTIGIGYNVEMVGGEITSWSDMFEYAGPVAWLDDRRGMFGVALLMLGFDPNSTDASEINAARDFLLDNGRNVVAIAADDGQVLLERGDVAMTVEYSGDIIDLIYECECDTFAYLIPEEGTNVWIDNLAIPLNAPNAELAMIFMDYVLHPQTGADISNFTAYASPNQTAIELGLIDEELLEDENVYPTQEMQDKFFFQLPVSPEVEELYNNAWDEMLIFLGQ